MGNGEKAPRVSVIMGVYNCAQTLPDAIESILRQSFTDWELILCDDGSTDTTFDVAASYENQYPEKIRLIKNECNLGLNMTLNRCLEIARGEYIARMDGDDLCASDRFEKEVFVLENEPDIAIVSTDMALFDDDGTWGVTSSLEYPMERDLLRGTPFCHAACMVRREAYQAVGGYSVGKRFLRVEDYHLWYKMYCAGIRGKNINQPLYSMRDDRDAYNRRTLRNRINEAYVRFLVVKNLHLPVWGYIFVLRPIIIALLPRFVYDRLHKGHLKRQLEGNE